MNIDETRNETIHRGVSSLCGCGLPLERDSAQCVARYRTWAAEADPSCPDCAGTGRSYPPSGEGSDGHSAHGPFPCHCAKPLEWWWVLDVAAAEAGKPFAVGYYEWTPTGTLTRQAICGRAHLAGPYGSEEAASRDRTAWLEETRD